MAVSDLLGTHAKFRSTLYRPTRPELLPSAYPGTASATQTDPVSPPRRQTPSRGPRDMWDIIVIIIITFYSPWGPHRP
jgi:hypothetical protein